MHDRNGGVPREVSAATAATQDGAAVVAGSSGADVASWPVLASVGPASAGSGSVAAAALAATEPIRPCDVAASWCAALVDEWVRAGAAHAVVCPGSRSTPLALALATDGRLAVHVVLDERSAGFVAIGLARASGRAAIVCVTSGTAAAELHAAVVEADLDGVPMLVCTADRPPELRDTGAAQTIDQLRVYGTSPRAFADPGVADLTAAGSWRPLAARWWHDAHTGAAGPGPVHVNLPFREPLVGMACHVPAGRADGSPWSTAPFGGAGAGAGAALLSAAPLASSSAALAWSEAAAVGTPWSTLRATMSGRRGVVVAGAGAGAPEQVDALADALGWPVLADARSGCRGLPSAVTVTDSLLRDAALAAALAPEVVVRLGAPAASKVVGQWLAAAPATVLVDPHGRWRDPDRSATLVVRAALAPVVAALHGVAAAPSPWSARWRAVQAAAEAALQGALAPQLAPGAAEHSLSDPAVARLVAQAGAQELVVSSSMPIRDLEWFGGAIDTATAVHANRGANGIDGVLSTAIGVALGSRRPTLLHIGDLAFLHDVSALVSARLLGDVPLVALVVDNAGGAIFEFLPQSAALERTRFEQLFGTPTGLDPADVASGFGVRVRRAGDGTELRGALADGLRSPGLTVVVVRTDRATAAAAHRPLHAAAIEAAHAALAAIGSPTGQPT